MRVGHVIIKSKTIYIWPTSSLDELDFGNQKFKLRLTAKLRKPLSIFSLGQPLLYACQQNTQMTNRNKYSFQRKGHVGIIYTPTTSNNEPKICR